MAFNYAREKRLFEAEWVKLTDEYRAAGFDEAGIQAMRDFDWDLFRQRRTYENHTQDLPSEAIVDDGDECSGLFKKFSSLTSGFDENVFSGRYGWIEAIDNPVLAGKLKSLNDSDKELLTLLAFDGYSQTEIGLMQGCTRSAVCQRITRIKKLLK